MYSLTSSSQQSTGTCVLWVCIGMLKWTPTSHTCVSREVYGLASVVYFTIHDKIFTVFSYCLEGTIEWRLIICKAVPNCMDLGGVVGVTKNIQYPLTVEQCILQYKAGGT